MNYNVSLESFHQCCWPVHLRLKCRSGVCSRWCPVCWSTDDSEQHNCQLHSTSEYETGKNTAKLSNVRNGLSVGNESKLHAYEIFKGNWMTEEVFNINDFKLLFWPLGLLIIGTYKYLLQLHKKWLSVWIFQFLRNLTTAFFKLSDHTIKQPRNSLNYWIWQFNCMQRFRKDFFPSTLANCLIMSVLGQ